MHPSPSPSSPRFCAQSPRPSARLSTVAVAVASALAGHAWANPSGPSVAAGAASFSTSGNTLSVTNAPGTIINWQQFSIRPDEITRFIQSGAASAVLNRVTGAEHSQLLGQLLSNGRVFLINPNGVTIGAGALIDTAGFVASSLNINDADFLSGRMRFQALGGDPGKVVNQGTIRTHSGGSIYLIAPTVENHGVTTAPNGDVLLAAGKSVEVVSTASPHIRVELAAPEGEAVNVGEVVAGRIGIYGGLVRNAGTLNATSAAVGENGNIILKASRDVRLESGTVRAGATDGGAIRIEGDRVIQGAAVDASGADGGTVTVQANSVMQSARIDARGTAGAGGDIDVQSAGGVVQTAGAVLDASGTTAGGTVTVQGTGERRVFSSATLTATASEGVGGTIKVLGNDIVLSGAKVDASGATGGGKVMVGGDFHGANPDVPNAQSLKTTGSTAIAADATANGRGGDVVLWADGTTSFGGVITARGGAQGGDGGRVEVSGKSAVQVTGHVDASAPQGAAGTLIIDPKNIVIAATAPTGTPAFELNDPNPGNDENFGASYVLAGNYVVATDPLDSPTVPLTYAGAAYVFDVNPASPTFSQLVSSIVGAAANDQVGSGGVTALAATTGFIVASPQFGGGRGAMTYGAAGAFAAGGGAVSGANSLVGGTVNANVGAATIDQFVSGTRFALVNPGWENGTGAVTFGDAAVGMPVGVLSAANSIVGSVAGDQVGSGGLASVGATFNEAVVIASPNWNGGTGAVTWVNMTGPTATPGDGTIAPIAAAVGPVAAANSLVGASPGDAIASGGMMPLYNGNLVISSPEWGGSAGASTWMNGTTGIVTNGTTVSDVVTTANSLTGTVPGDFLGQTVTPLSNGNYVLMTPALLNNSGAATLVAGAAGGGGRPIVFGVTQPVAPVGGTNSLLGGTLNAFAGATVQELFDGGVGIAYAVMTPSWNSNQGAVTISPTGGAGAGPNALISGLTSLVGGTPGGTFAGDQVGTAGSLFDIGNGKYVLASPNWTNIATTANRAGALTYIDAAAPPVGAISAVNSLVGTQAEDRVGSGTTYDDLIALSGGWFAFHSPNWNGGAGAVTFFTSANAGTRLVGPLTSTNSLVGATAGDRVGTFDCDGTCNGITDMFNGTFLVASPGWSNGAATGAGAVTLVDASRGTRTGPISDGTGVVTTINSLYGTTAGDAVGGSNLTLGGGVYRLDNDRFAISSPDWANGADTAAGALTFGSVSAWTPGPVTVLNSLHGTNADDRIGSDGLLQVFSAGPAVFGLASSRWNGDTGAVTFFDAAAAPAGQAVGAGNSVVGVAPGDVIGSNGFVDVGAGKALILSPNWRGGLGAATLVDVNAARTGVLVTAANSFTGAVSGDAVGAYRVTMLPNGNFILRSGAGGLDALTFMTPGAARAGETLSTANSLIGGSPTYGRLGFDLRVLPSGDYIVVNSGYNMGMGMIVYGSGTTGVVGNPSTTNGWLGTAPGEQLGASVQMLTGNQFVFNAPGATKGTFTNAGRLYVANPSGLGSTVFNGTLLFGDPGSDPNPTVLSATQIADFLNSGTAVLLQAGNDITVNAPISATGTTSASGSLTMQAGRSILVNESITNLNRDDSTNRSITLSANDPAAPAAQRDPGPGELRVAPGKVIVGGGDVVLEVLDNARAGVSAGGMTVGSVTGQNVELYNSSIAAPAFDAARSIDIAAGSVITVTERFALVADGDARFGIPGGAGARVEGMTTSTDVVAFGAILGGTGTLIDSTTASNPVNLSAQSIGAPGQPFGVVHGPQGVTALATTGGIHLAQTTGVLDTGFFSLDAPAGQQVSLGALGGPLDVSVLALANANPTRLYTSGNDIAFIAPATPVNAASLQLDAAGGQVLVPGGVTFDTALQSSSPMVLQGGTTNFNGASNLNGLTVVGNNTVANLAAGAMTTSSLTWGTPGTAENNTITGAAGATLTVTGPAGAAISGDGTRRLTNVALTLGAGTSSQYLAATGTGAFEILNNASLVNNGVFNLQNDQAITAGFSGTPASFVNNGILNKQAGAGTSVLGGGTYFGLLGFDNNGTVNVQSGTLALSGPGTHTGAFNVATGATLGFAASTHTVAASAGITGPGQVVVSGPATTVTVSGTLSPAGTLVNTGTLTLAPGSVLGGQLAIAGGTVAANGTANTTALNVSGGTLTIGGPFVTQAYAQAGGAVGGTGSLTVQSNFALTGGTLAGTLSDLYINQASGNLVANGLGAVNNIKLIAPNGAVTVGTPITVGNLAEIGGANVAMNADVSAGLIKLMSPNVALGSVTLTGALDASAASLIVPDGAAVALAGGGAKNVRDLTVGIGGATLALGGPTTVSNNFAWQGGSGAGTISGGSLTLNGTGAIGGDGTHVLSATTVTNNGTLTFGPTFGAGGPLLIQDGAVLSNNGLFDIRNDQRIYNDIYYAPGTLNNAGTLIKSGAGGATVLGGGMGTFYFNNTGTVQIDSGRLVVAEAGTQTGTVTIGSSSGLEFSNGAHTLGGNVSGGTLAVSGGASVLLVGTLVANAMDISGGTLDIGGSANTNAYVQTGGAVGGTGNLTVASSFNRSGGTLGNTFNTLSVTQASGDIDSAGFGATGQLALAALSGAVNVTTPLALAGNASFLGGTGINVMAPVSAASVGMVSPGTVRISNATVTATGGAISVGAGQLEVIAGSAPAGLIAGGGLSVVSLGDVIVQGGSAPGSFAKLAAGGGPLAMSVQRDLKVLGGTGANAYGLVLGSPDAGSASAPIKVGGVIEMQGGSGSNAYARIESTSPDSIYVAFPNLASGGYTVNGQAVTNVDGSGFYAGGVPAILAQNLLIDYGLASLPQIDPGVLVTALNQATQPLDDGIEAQRRAQLQQAFDDIDDAPICK